MPKYFLILLLFLNLSVYSQESSVEFKTDIGFFNNNINAELLFQSFGFLDETEKYNILNVLKSKNNIAFEMNNSFTYKNSKEWGLSLSNNVGAYATYSKSLAQLILLGNTPFKGENLKLDPIDITAFNYTQLKFLYKWNKKIETNVGLILGHHLLNANVNKGYFYTDSQASFINYELDYEAHFTNSIDLRQNPYSNNGYGASFGMRYKESIDKGSIQITISDIGFINWNKKTTNIYIKNQYEFEGIYVDNFINFNDSIIRNEIDSLQYNLQVNTKESFIWKIPTRLSLKINQSLNSSFIQTYSITMDHRINLYNTPRFAIEISKKIKKHNMTLGYHIGGVEHIGFQFKYFYLGEKNQLYICTKQFNFGIPSLSYGLHVGIGIKRVFSRTN